MRLLVYETGRILHQVVGVVNRRDIVAVHRWGKGVWQAGEAAHRCRRGWHGRHGLPAAFYIPSRRFGQPAGGPSDRAGVGHCSESAVTL